VDYTDITIIGGGIIGMAAAMALARSAKESITVLEAEKKLAPHQTGNNSGVIHSGLYYKPGSLKAKNCVEGRKKLYQFCNQHHINVERCGKVVIAATPKEIPNLEELERRGRENGLKGLKRLSANEINQYEPYAAGIDGLFVPETGIVDYKEVTNKYAEIVLEEGHRILKSHRFIGLQKNKNRFIVKTETGEIETKFLINCGGLQSDRIAKKCGVEPGIKIVPFRGEYYTLKPEKHHLVKNLIYPVPDPAFPFLGVHFTRMIKGGVEAGPNAVLSFKREGYHKFSFSLYDALDTLSFSGFRKMAAKYTKMGFGEFYRSWYKPAFVKALQKLIPAITEEDIVPAPAGVRAQAIENTGALVDDFRIVETDKMIHILNAPSPAATASISIGEKIGSLAVKKFNLTNTHSNS
jgi:L-2-hydroxyglutarate oxidase